MPVTVEEARAALRVAAWRDEIGELPAEDLVPLALDAVVAGIEGEQLVELAGADGWDPRDQRDLWVSVLEEQDIGSVGEQVALWQLVRETASRVVDGTADPIGAAKWLWRPASDRLEPEGDLRIFIGLASEADDHPDQRQVIADEVVNQCRLLLARPRPRRWLRLKADVDHVLSLATTSGQSPRGLEELPVPEALAARLLAWRNQWTDVMRRGGFVSVRSAQDFVTAGGTLAEALQEVLGDEWHVEYYPEPIRLPGVRLRSGRYRRSAG